MPEDGFWMDLFSEGYVKCAYYLSPICKKWFKPGEGHRGGMGLEYCSGECYEHLGKVLNETEKLRGVKEDKEEEK